MKTDILFSQRRGKKFPHSFKQKTQWLIEMRPLRFPELSIVELVTATCFDDAVAEAFSTRNIAADWKVTEVEEVFDENS